MLLGFTSLSSSAGYSAEQPHSRTTLRCPLRLSCQGFDGTALLFCPRFLCTAQSSRRPQFSTLFFFVQLNIKGGYFTAGQQRLSGRNVTRLPVAPNGSSPVRLRLPSAIGPRGVGLSALFVVWSAQPRSLRTPFFCSRLWCTAPSPHSPWFSLFSARVFVGHTPMAHPHPKNRRK
jgi:hypothetical protein